MYTINSDISNEIIIKNSRFICVCYKIYSKEDILNYLDNSYIKKICGDMALEVIKCGAYYAYIVSSSTGLIL